MSQQVYKDYNPSMKEKSGSIRKNPKTATFLQSQIDCARIVTEIVTEKTSAIKGKNAICLQSLQNFYIKIIRNRQTRERVTPNTGIPYARVECRIVEHQEKTERKRTKNGLKIFLKSGIIK